GCELTCPRHGAKFNVKTGAPTKMPATEPVRTFPVEVRDGAVYVKYDG
ncbi:MAG: Rieske 2Fe-2S domain-containing protein, partial [Planctomicrobium sp.]|nr:Rieske 2Fe-2S domain-containing protein [Planctomicrobium sp.]